jgi:Arc/MetJ-type ribon-helix-helix transcriptional regulator
VFAGEDKLTGTHQSRTLVVSCRLLRTYAEQLSEAFCDSGHYASLGEFLRSAIREKAERELPQLFTLKNLQEAEQEVNT